MKTFKLMAKDGATLVLAEAASSIDAELWGWRNLPGKFSRLEEVTGGDEPDPKLVDAFTRICGSREAGLIAARGRRTARPFYPTVTVGKQPPLGSSAAPLHEQSGRVLPRSTVATAAVVELRETEDAEASLRRSFERMGHSPEAAGVMARGRR